MEPAEILHTLERLKATATVRDGQLRLQYPRSATAKIQSLGPEIKRHKDKILLLVQPTNPKPEEERILDGHRVCRVVWETEKMVIYQDSDGHFWRYLYDWGKSWPVVIESSRKESA